MGCLRVTEEINGLSHTMHPDEIPNPTDEQLGTLDREVCFVPTENDDPKVLTSEQISHYNEFGYLMPFDGLDEDEIRNLRNFFEGALEAFRTWAATVTR